MKALFYLLDGDTNASSYYRVLQYFPWLRAHGIQPYASRPTPALIYDRWMEHRSGRTAEKFGFYGLFLTRRLLHVLRANQFDVVVIQRDLFPFGPPLLERLLRRVNPRIVYDTDDATYMRPSFTPDTVFQRFRRFDKVSEVVRHAHWVTVATEPLAAWARQLNQNVTIIPMTADLARYEAAFQRRATGTGDAPFVIGWTGTAGGFPYLEALAPVLRRVAERHSIQVRVISGAYQQVRLPGVPLDARPWNPDTELDEFARFNAGLVPLDDSPFERAKFPGKLLRYLGLGVPAVAARVGATADIVTHEENGLLVSSPEEWQAALERLIQDAPLRARLSAAGRATVAEHYALDRVAPRLADVLQRVARGDAAVPPTPPGSGLS